MHYMVLLCHPQEDKTFTLSICPCASSPPAGWTILCPSIKALGSFIFPHDLSHPTGLSLIQCSIAPAHRIKPLFVVLWLLHLFPSLSYKPCLALFSLLCRILNPRGICWLRETVWWDSKNRVWSISNRNHGVERARTLLSSIHPGGGPSSCISFRKYLN